MMPERYNEISPDLLKEILTASLNEIYVFDAKTLRFIFVNEGACKNLGYSFDELYNMTPYDIKPEFTSETFRATLKPLLTKEADKLTFESTHRRKDGSEYPIDIHLQLIERDGGPVFLAIINDITERKDTENTLITQYNLSRRLLDAIPHPAWLITREKKIKAQNKAGQEFGTKIGDYCWKAIHNMKTIPADKREYYLEKGVPAADTQCFFCMTSQMFAQKKTLNKEIELDNRVWDILWIPVDDETYLHYLIDLTERKKNETNILKLTRIYTLLSDVNHAIVHIRETQTLFEEICRIAVEKGGFRMAWIGITSPAANDVNAVASAGVTNGYIKELGIVLTDELRGNGPTGKALKAATYIICNDIEHDPRMEPWREHAIRIGYRSSAAFPLNVMGELKGVLNLYSDKTGFFDEQEIRLLDELALDISFAMEFAEKEMERRRTEEIIKRTTMEWNTAMDMHNDVIYLLDTKRRIIYANNAFYLMTGSSPETAIGRHIKDIIHVHGEAEPCPICHAQEEKKDTTIIMEADNAHNPSGRPIEINVKVIRDSHGEPLSILMTLHDLTHDRLAQEEKAALEKQLLHAQKMETVGTLAGGVAHDFNNILTAIIGYGQVALMKMPKDDPNRKYIENMLEASDRAANLTQGLLTFSRKSMSDQRPIELNAVIRDVQKLLKRMISEDIALNTALSDEELTVVADRNQIEQMLMNLAVNARDAMPHGGAFTIKTEKTTIEDWFVKTHGYGISGQYVLITLSDTGMGMDKKTCEHIFEPFFTTKEVGKGTGLGLSVVYGIVKQHRGYINVYSEPGLGTTFRIYLPIIQTETDKKTPQEEDADDASYLHGKETILLAEDNEQVREFTKIVLMEAGYRVIEAIDGEDAVKKFIENKDDINMLLFDLIMPKKTGNNAYNEINKLEPGIKALFMTGYSPELVGQNISQKNMTPVVYKPISPKDLLKEIRRVLG